MPAQSSHSTLSDQAIKESTSRRALLKLLLISTVLSVVSILWLDLPEKITKGERGHEAIQMLDAMRRPLLAIEGAELQFETEQDRIASDRLSQAIKEADALVEEYLGLAEYNEELLQSVSRFKDDYTDWVATLRRLHLDQDPGNTNGEISVAINHHSSMASDHFLRVMDHLGEGEAPIHHDIDEGRFATRVMALFLTAIILIQLTAFIIQVMLKNAKLSAAREQLQHEIETREEADARIDLLVNNMAGVIYSCQYDKQGAFIPTFCTPNIEEMMGYTPEDFYNKENFWAANIHPDDSAKVFENYERLFREERLLHRYRWRHHDGSYHWIRDEITLIRDESGEPDQIVGVWVNIDEQKAIELELESYRDGLEESVAELKTKNREICKILDEKDVLFKELHHRVKNNMQVISALLELQAMKCDNVEVVEALTKGKDRIESMALVHELLYQTDDMSRVNLVDYLKELSQGLLVSHSDTAKGVSVSVAGVEWLIPIEPVVPIGLIINELVTNSLKYGFEKTANGKIDVSCSRDAEENLVILYADNGVGLPETALSEQHTSLGLNLIANLSKQLGASIRFYNDDGMRFELIVAV